MKHPRFDPKYDNVPVIPIDLNSWLKDHPSAFLKRYGRIDPCLEPHTEIPLQIAHLNGDYDIYEPVEAYSIKWFHKGDRYYPIDDSKKRDDLPPVYIQWKEDYRKRNERIKQLDKRNIQSRKEKR